MLPPIWDPFAWLFPAVARFVRNLFFRTSGVYPPWSDCVDCLEDFGSRFAPKIKDSRATHGTNHTFKKTSKDSKKRYRSSMQTNNFNLCCLTKPRKSEAPGLKTDRVSGAPEGICGIRASINAEKKTGTKIHNVLIYWCIYRKSIHVYIYIYIYIL